MKTFMLFLLLLPLIGSGQTVNIPTGIFDSNLFRHWNSYLADCNELVPDTIKQDGVVNVKYKPVIVNGEVSHYILSPVDTVWTDCKCGKYKIGNGYGLTSWKGLYIDSLSTHRWYVNNALTGSITYSKTEQVDNKINITRNKICHIKKRKATWSDFWERWLVEQKVIEMN